MKRQNPPTAAERDAAEVLYELYSSNECTYAEWLERTGEEPVSSLFSWDRGARALQLAGLLVDLSCPRCHGTGKAADVDGKDCGICNGLGIAHLTFAAGTARKGGDSA